jgi:choline dehydrogenase-like flavoprotein
VRPDGTPAYLVTLSWYVPTTISAENRVTFSADERDATGLPRMSVAFDYSVHDLELIDQASASQAVVAARLSGGGVEAVSTVLPPGSSLHYTGTVRMGPSDDGSSVCDSDGRVWGYENLYVAGNGVIPTALVCNSTLTALTLAVRTARAVAGSL